jgi:MFS family permease
VDTFATHAHKTLMLSLLLLAPPLGVVFGYLFTGLLSAHLSWHWAFYLQAIVSVGPTFLGLLAISERYFDIELAVARKEGGPRGGQQHHRSQTGGT